MNKSLEMIKGFLATQLNYIPILLAVLILHYGIIKKEPTMWKYALLSLLPFVFYLIRLYVKQIVVFFILHAGVMILPYFLAQNVTETVFFILLGLIFCIISCYFKVAKQWVEDGVLFPAMTCIIAIISYFVALNRGGGKKAGMIVAMSIVYIVYYIIRQYIQGYVDYIKNNAISNQNIPHKHIFRTSLSALVGFLTLFVGFATLLANLNIFSDLIQKIGRLIERFMIWLLKFVPEPMEQAEKTEEASEHMEYLETMGEKVDSVNKLPPEIVELINNIVTIGAYVIMGIFILIITYAIFMAIVAAFKVKRDDNEEEVVLVKEKTEKLRLQKTAVSPRESRFSKDKKIRKMYEDLIYKTALKYKKNSMEKNDVIYKLKHQTPKEQCYNLKSNEVIRRLYEETRYSNKEVTKDDVRRMKELCLLEGKK